MLFNYKSFFGLLERGLERKGLKLKTWLEDELEWSESKIQRRITGAAPPSIDEIIEIFIKAPDHALLSFELFEQLRVMLVEQTSFSNEAEFLDYFNRLEELFEHHLQLGDSVLHYAAYDIPLFLFTKDKALLEFKFAVWTNTIYNGIIAELPPEVHLKARKVTALYMKLPGKETWYHRAMEQQLEQLQTFLRQGYISQAQYGQLIRLLHASLLEHLNWVRKGEKNDGVFHKVSVAPFFTIGNGAALLSEKSNLIWSALWNAQVISSNTTKMTAKFMEEWTYHRKISTYLTGASPALLNAWQEKIDALLKENTSPLSPF